VKKIFNEVRRLAEFEKDFGTAPLRQIKESQALRGSSFLALRNFRVIK